MKRSAVYVIMKPLQTACLRRLLCLLHKKESRKWSGESTQPANGFHWLNTLTMWMILPVMRIDLIRIHSPVTTITLRIHTMNNMVQNPADIDLRLRLFAMQMKKSLGPCHCRRRVRCQILQFGYIAPIAQRDMARRHSDWRWNTASLSWGLN